MIKQIVKQKNNSQKNSKQTVALYVVATPIGNLEDITLRALRTLSEVDVIACEDTRVTKKLLTRHNISKPLVSFHARSGQSKTSQILNFLGEGKNIALVSDAGTPTISDPGSVLISAVRERFGENVSIIPIPGASALTTALSVSGLPSSEFLFLGFLPHKKGRQKLFKEISESKRTIVFYESPHRIVKTLDLLVSTLSSDRRVFIARELTKVYETLSFGTAEEVRRAVGLNTNTQKGEFVIAIEPK